MKIQSIPFLPGLAVRARPAAVEGTLLCAAVAATVLLPPALLYARAVADILLSVTALLFLARCTLAGDWSALRATWFRLGLALWAWVLLVTAVVASPPVFLQALVMVRLLVFALALESWVLASPAARHWLFWMVVACAGWIVLESWQQYLLGTNLAGYPRWNDGALTGPFWKPRAGATLVVIFFPAFLPLIMERLERRRLAARLAGLGLLALGVATMVLIGQRMPTLLTILGLVAAGLLLRRFRAPMLAALLAGAVVVALTPLLSPPTFQKLVVHFLEQMRHFPTSNYGLLYVRALVMLEAHPWLGLGFDGFRHGCADPQYFLGISWLNMTAAQSGGLSGCNLHPHNYYLELATDGGLPGLILFAAFAVVCLSRLAGDLRHDAAPLRVALFVASLLTFWPLASTSALFVLPTGGWAFLLLGWGLAERLAAETAPRPAATTA